MASIEKKIEEEGIEARWALIAGACEEAGREAAHALARHGVNLHLADTSGGELNALADEIDHSFEVDTECHVMDLTEHLNAEVLALECDNAGILVICPGPVPEGTLIKLDTDDWRKGFESRVMATIALVREVYETLQERGSGIIILDLSPHISGATPGPPAETILHSTAGGALSALVHVLQEQSSETGIRVLETDAERARALIDDLMKAGGNGLG